MNLSLEKLVDGLIKFARENVESVVMNEQEIRTLGLAVTEIFLKQPTLLEVTAPIKICGTIGGQYHDLLHLFEVGGWPPASRYLFLGNYYGNIGSKQLEVLCLLWTLKIKYPNDIYLLRGTKYNSETLWEVVTDCFNCMPVSAIIGEKIFCVHSGLSPELGTVEQIKQLVRPSSIYDSTLLYDLLWAEPDQDIHQGWGEGCYSVSYMFGCDVVEKFLKKHNFSLMCNSYMVEEEGYHFFPGKQLVSLFSATDYKAEYDNIGAIMSVDGKLQCSFQLFFPKSYQCWTPQAHKSHPKWTKDAIICTLLIAKQQAWPFDRLVIQKILAHIAFGWYKSVIDPQPSFSINTPTSFPPH